MKLTRHGNPGVQDSRAVYMLLPRDSLGMVLEGGF